MFLNNNVCKRIHTTIDIETKTYFSLFIQRIISRIIIDVRKVKNNPIKEYLVILFISNKILSAFSFTSSLPLRPNTAENSISNNLEKLDKNKNENSNKEGIKTNKKYGWTATNSLPQRQATNK